MAEYIFQRDISQASQLQQIRNRFRSTKDLHTYLADNCKFYLYELISFDYLALILTLILFRRLSLTESIKMQAGLSSSDSVRAEEGSQVERSAGKDSAALARAHRKECLPASL